MSLLVLVKFQILMSVTLVSSSVIQLTPNRTMTDPTCGNGLVEDGEECDCGMKQDCIRVGYICCRNCKFVSRGTVCRDAVNSCDVPEFCNGTSELCPIDLKTANGLACGNEKGYCHEGECRTRTEQCNGLWNGGAFKADDACYLFNERGDKDGYCKQISDGRYSACAPKNIQCGKLWCIGNSTITPKYPGNLEVVNSTFEHWKIYCRSVRLSYTPGSPVSDTVLDGTKCGNNMVCQNNECVSLSVVNGGQRTCPNSCNGTTGVCNENGNCHCNKGWKCPNCTERYDGPGGSSDSGLDCSPVTKPPCQCSYGSCCKNCQFVSRGTVCRDAVNSCDVPEFCNGTSGFCPIDLKTANGISCGNEKGYCIDGECRTHTEQCNSLWNGGAFKANDACYIYNLRGDKYGYCKELPNGAFPACAPKNVQCGKLWCIGNSTITPKSPGYLDAPNGTLDHRKIFCRSVRLYHAPNKPQLDTVLNGTKCGNNMVCQNNECVSLAVAYGGQRTCPKNCNGTTGVCNENGNCHCFKGWKCPNCTERYDGPGGSTDSGLDCSPVTKPPCQCSYGSCCKNCQIVARGTVCREAVNSCDVPEYCDGKSELCPVDLKTMNGLSCKMQKGYCYKGECRTRDEQCDNWWFGGAFAANDLCYARYNQFGNITGYCKRYSVRSYKACTSNNTHCGKLWCIGNSTITEKSLGYGTYWNDNWSNDRKIHCRSAIIYQAPGKPALGTVLDGTKCGSEMVCQDNACVSLSVAYAQQPKCATDCNGNGVCNENGHCHCNQGWRCPNCTEAYDGPGGSIDNGLSCQFPTTTTPPPTTTAPSTAPKEETTEIPGTETEQSFLEILMPLLIVLVGLLIFLCFTIFCYNRRNHLRQNTTEEAIIVEEDNEEADNEEADNVQANHEHAYENDHFDSNFTPPEGNNYYSYVEDCNLYENPEDLIPHVEYINVIGEKSSEATTQVSNPTTQASNPTAEVSNTEHLLSIAYMSLNENREPDHCYQHLNSPDTGAGSSDTSENEQPDDEAMEEQMQH